MKPRVAVVMVIAVALLIYILTTHKSDGITDWSCTIKYGVPNFRLPMLCGKMIYAQYMSGIEGNYSCVVGQFKCYDDDTVTCDSVVFERGLKFTQSATLTDLGNGVVLREASGPDGELVQALDIVTSFSLFANGDIKASYYICATPREDNHLTMRAIITTFKKADLTDDIKLMNRLFTCGGFYHIPNVCDVNNFYNKTETTISSLKQ